jgi:hypothetical protein
MRIVRKKGSDNTKSAAWREIIRVDQENDKRKR